MSTICFFSQFTASKVGVNSLTVTWDIEQITRADGTCYALVTGGANGITIGRRGLYGYVLTNADLSLYDYVATAITADTTVDQKEISAVWTLWSISWHDIATSIMTLAGSIGKLFTDNINATINSRSTYAGGDTAGTTTLLSRILGTLDTGTHKPQSGDAFARIGASGSGLTAIWDRLTSSITTPNSIGAWILDKLDVKVSSVSIGSVPTVAQIWNYAWRTLTTNHNQVVVNENTLQCNTCNTFYQPIEDLGSFTNYVALYFTVKQSKKDGDAQAIFQVMKRADSVGDGLLRAFGQAATLSNGSITISDSSLGNIIVEISDTLMTQLQVGTYYADVKIIRSAGVKSEILRNLVLNAVDTPTKAIS